MIRLAHVGRSALQTNDVESRQAERVVAANVASRRPIRSFVPCAEADPRSGIDSPRAVSRTALDRRTGEMELGEIGGAVGHFDLLGDQEMIQVLKSIAAPGRARRRAKARPCRRQCGRDKSEA